MMDWVLCDELLQEIFLRLPPASLAPASLVSRRWRSLLLSSLAAITLHLPDHAPAAVGTFFPLPLLASLTSLTLLSGSPPPPLGPVLALLPRPLLNLRLLLGPLPPYPDLLSPALRHLRSLHLSSLRPLSFHWLPALPLLAHLAVLDCSADPGGNLPPPAAASAAALPLASLSLSLIRSPDPAFAWLWPRCRRLRTLQLRACESTGADDDVFAAALPGLRRLEIRASRAVSDGVLRLAAELSPDLDALLLYDGGGREALRAFFARSPRVSALDLRLPLDLDDSHLRAAAARRVGMRSLRLHSCCLVSGEGLRLLAAAGGALEELALVGCDVVEREEGAVTHVAQGLRGLRRLDVSYNEGMGDRELAGVAAAMGGRMLELRVRGCRRLSGAGISVVARWCAALEEVDLRACAGVCDDGVEALLRRCNNLRRVWVEDCKLGRSCRDLARRKGVRLLAHETR